MLRSGETVLWHRRPHFGSVALAAVLLPVFTAVAGICGGLVERHADGTAASALWGIVAAVWIVLVWWRCVWPWLEWRTTHFAVTDQRVLVRQGVVRHRHYEVELGLVDDVRISRSPGERLVGAGTLVLHSWAGGPLQFGGLPRVRRAGTVVRNAAGLR